MICLEIAEEPWQLVDCGRLLCKKCLDKLKRRPCPNCRKEKPQFFPDNRGGSQRKLQIQRGRDGGRGRFRGD